MKDKNLKRLERVSRLFLGILIAVFLMVLLRTGVRTVFVEKLQLHAPWIDMLFMDSPDYTLTPREQQEKQSSHISVDWAARYPFEGEDTLEPGETAASGSSAGILEKISRKMEALEWQVDTLEQKIGTNMFKKMIPAYNTIVSAASGIEARIGWNIPQYFEYNPVMELEENYFVSPQLVHNGTAAIDELQKLRDFCREQGAELIVVIPPSKVDPRMDRSADGSMDFSNRNRNFLAQQLRDRSIDCIDLRDNIREQNLNTHEMFFETDHHWTPETGLWAADQIAGYLNGEKDWDLDTGLLESEQYEKTVLEDWMLGSLGKKVTLSRADPEDFSILLPKYDTLLTLQVPSRGVDRTGDFRITYDPEPVETRNLMGKDPYAAYAYCNEGLIRYINHREASGKSILLIKDSFGNVVSPFLSQTVSRMNVLDLRLFQGSVHSFIRENKPDAVVVLYSTPLPESIDWSSHQEFYDFR